MRSPTWDEYLATTTAYLTALRRAAERGGPPPEAPLRPDEPVPEESAPEVRRLLDELGELADEVSARLSALGSRTGAIARRRPSPPPAFYVDTPV